MRKPDFGKEELEHLRGRATHLRDVVWDAIKENLKNRDATKSYLASDNEIFIPLIDTYALGIMIHSMESYFCDLAKRILHEDVEEYEQSNGIKVNKEHLFFAISMLSIRCGDEVSSMVYWELAQKEHEYTYGVATGLDDTINLLRTKFRGVLEPVKHVFDDNKLIKTLRPKFPFIKDFETTLAGLTGLNKAHFLSCGIKQVHLLAKMRKYPDVKIIRIFAQELVNSLCILNESLLKKKGLPGDTIGVLMQDVYNTYPAVGAHLGQSGPGTGIYSIGKPNFYGKYNKFIAFLEGSITDDNKLKGDILYALHQLRNEALHIFDDTRLYYNDVDLFEKTIGLLFICVSVINDL